ncbi:hypothetical protein [Polaribacter sp. OB-PA-B3]
MKTNYILALLTILTLNSCGKSEKEIKIEKEKLELKAENERKKIELEKIHEQKVNVGKRKKITELTMQLQRLPEAIKKAQENIEKINKFQIGRSQSTKDKQLKKAYKQLSEIRNYGEKLKNEIAQLEYLKTFEFQKDPESVMKYIFESAKKGDFSNFRNLCDPYGENDSDVNSICYAEMLSKERKKELQDSFKNGRIIGKPVIKDNIAEIEFAYGVSSNRLEKMGMVKRNGLWYLSGF